CPRESNRASRGPPRSAGRSRPPQRRTADAAVGTRAPLLGRNGRLGAFDLHAHAGAHVRPVVPDGAMLGAAVVPECDRVLAPVEAHLPLRVLDVLEQEAEDGVALLARYAVDLRGLAAVHVEKLPAGPGMHGDHRVRAHWVHGVRALVEELGAIVR